MDVLPTPQAAELAAVLVTAGVDPPLVEPLARYGALILDANTRVNLTGARSAKDVASHLLDGLSVIPYVGERHVDIGSGGGLPGIVIALATGAHVMLVEAIAKKAAFLQEVQRALGLSGGPESRCTVVCARAEAVAHEAPWRERFSSGTARAVASAPTVAELLLPFIEVGGAAILQRGTMDDPERRALADASLVLGAAVEREIPLNGERRIVLVRKTAPTPPRFPRRTGIPQKRPLCT